VTPKEFGNALHVAGWVAWWMGRASDLQLITAADEKKVLHVVFPQFYKAATDSPQGMEIRGIESPDEGKLRDNDLVTNLLAKRVARWAADHGVADGEDLEWFNSIVIQRARDALPATYDDDLLRGYQQTAALLAIYPLEENFGEGVAEKMFDRYADLTSEVGPAMSESIHATIAARLGRKDAYKRWRKSWQTYTDDAMMFHERRNKEDAYFMTGAAGCLQTVLYGFAGMHLEKEGIAAAASKPIGNGYQVAFRPNLPAEWKSLTLHNVSIGPRRATVRIDHSGVSIE
jgi:trehalose/maltose hydrolase-like predicted phosphorylase